MASYPILRVSAWPPPLYWYNSQALWQRGA